MKKAKWSAAVFAIMAFTACSNDYHAAPNYEMQYVDIVTDTKGTGSVLLTDKGEQLQIVNPFNGMKADTVYRYVVYLIRQDGGVNVAASTLAVCDIPKTFQEDEIKTDSVKMQSIWRGGSYVNLTLLVPHRDRQHEFSYIDRGITVNDNDHKTLCIQLYHNANNDFPAFSATCYLSCSLKPYREQLQTGRDSIRFIINEYKKGQTTYCLPY